MIDADGCAKGAICSVHWRLDMRSACMSGVRCLRGHLLTKKTVQITRKGYKRCRRCLAIADAKFRSKQLQQSMTSSSTK